MSVHCVKGEQIIHEDWFVLRLMTWVDSPSSFKLMLIMSEFLPRVILLTFWLLFFSILEITYRAGLLNCPTEGLIFRKLRSIFTYWDCVGIELNIVEEGMAWALLICLDLMLTFGVMLGDYMVDLVEFDWSKTAYWLFPN